MLSAVHLKLDRCLTALISCLRAGMQPKPEKASNQMTDHFMQHERCAAFIAGVVDNYQEGRQIARSHFLNVAVLPALSECMRLAGLGPSSEFIRAAYGSNAGLFLLPALSCRVLLSKARCAWRTDWAWV